MAEEGNEKLNEYWDLEVNADQQCWLLLSQCALQTIIEALHSQLHSKNRQRQACALVCNLLICRSGRCMQEHAVKMKTVDFEA